MKLKIYILLFIAIILNIQEVSSQDLNISADQLNSINIDELSDEEISEQWDKAKKEGYSLEQLAVILESKGMSISQVSKLKQRILSLNINSLDQKEEEKEVLQLEEEVEIDNNPKKSSENLLFGYDFFSNPNISFGPSSNFATPKNYQLGPGDELLIDIWGAAENNYKEEINSEGSLKLKNIGPIYIGGLSIEEARSKIISYLKKIYSGIGASNNSYNKVYVDISLTNVRTVQVNIIGEVKVPGTYSLSALTSVMNALYAAGGPTINGTFREIQVIRNGKQLEEFDVYSYLVRGSQEGNILLKDQDVIIVKPYISRVEVVGKVKRPGLYELKNNETLSMLMKYFSGFTSDAYKERINVERINEKQKEISEIILSDSKDYFLVDGDKIIVDAILDRYENRVQIEGAVYRPGIYELSEGLTLLGLIKKSEGVLEEAFLDRGIIYRNIDDVKQEIVSFSVNKILNESEVLVLKREDKVHIFSKDNLIEKSSISIDGAINNPQTLDFVEKMTVDDLIALSGGFSEGADVNVIDISRRALDGNFKTISTNIKKSSSSSLWIDGKESFYLRPFDRVSVRYLKGYSLQKSVTINGEVSYPGNYSIVNKDDRISDLVNKAGGFSPYAYIKGATLIRRVSSDSEIEQLKLLETIAEKNSSVTADTDVKEFKIGIDLEKIMNENNSKYDLILKEGDLLIIPSEKQTVEVRGEVLAPSLIRYDKTNSLKDYINKSGGFSDKAKKSKAYVIYANGDVSSAKNFIFFKSYPRLKPGSIIIIPQKSEKNKTSVQEVIGVTTGLATLGLLINTLVK